MADLPTLQFLHPFYVASDLPDLDEAFEDGKRRALLTLERQAAKVRAVTRADYEREFCRPRHKGSGQAILDDSTLVRDGDSGEG